MSPLSHTPETQWFHLRPICGTRRSWTKLFRILALDVSDDPVFSREESPSIVLGLKGVPW